jgi:hypothetical protein
MYGELGYAAAYIHLFYVLFLCGEVWINVLLHTSALVGPLHIGWGCLRIGCRERYTSLSAYVFNVATGLYLFNVST